jgi:hypothetical protein
LKSVREHAELRDLRGGLKGLSEGRGGDDVRKALPAEDRNQHLEHLRFVIHEKEWRG